MFNHFRKYSAWRCNNVKCSCMQGIKLERSPRSNYLSRIRQSFTKTGHDCIRAIFENLRFRPSTRIRKVSVFENLHSGDHFGKPRFSVIGDRIRRLQRKKSPFPKVSGYVKTGPYSEGREGWCQIPVPSLILVQILILRPRLTMCTSLH